MNPRTRRLPLFTIAVILLSAALCAAQDQPPSFDLTLPFWARPGDTLAIEGAWNSPRQIILSVPGKPTKRVRSLRITVANDGSARFVTDSIAAQFPGGTRVVPVRIQRLRKTVNATIGTDARIHAHGVVSPRATSGVHFYTVAVDYQSLTGPDSTGPRRALPPQRETQRAGLYIDSDSTRALDLQRQIIEAHLTESCRQADSTDRKVVIFVAAPSGVHLSDEFRQRWQNTTLLEAPGGRQPDSVCLGMNNETNVWTVVISYTRMHWVGPDEVRFESAYQCGPLCGSGAEYRATRTGATWTVTRLRQTWVQLKEAKRINHHPSGHCLLLSLRFAVFG